MTSKLRKKIERHFYRWWVPRSTKQGSPFYGCSENWGAMAAYIAGFMAGMRVNKQSEVQPEPRK